MVYKRNSKLQKEKPQESRSLARFRRTAPKIEKAISTQLAEDLQFLRILKQKEKFSQDWFNSVLEDILFKCMGFKTVHGTFFGQSTILRIFDPKTAKDIVHLLMKTNGVKIAPDIHVIDGTKTQNNFFNVQLESNSEKTAKVIEILQNVGKFNPELETVS